MENVSKSTWLVGILLLLVLGFAGNWGYVYVTHSTPQKAQSAINPGVGPFETIKFAKGVVLITPSGQPQSLTAWYVTKGFWGWRVRGTSDASLGLSPQNYNVDFEALHFDGETFVWGTTMIPLKEIIYRHNGHTYTSQVGKLSVWHIILPFTQTYFSNSEWSMVLPNGDTAPLLK